MVAMGLVRKKATITRAQALSARPERVVAAELIEAGDGAKLKVPLRQTRWSGWLFRLPEGASKTFELDPMGLLVWNSCDGKTSVQQIIRILAKRYNLNLREAEIPTLSFLQTLVKKGLLSVPVPGGSRSVATARANMVSTERNPPKKK
jgi:hypothetical protein